MGLAAGGVLAGCGDTKTVTETVVRTQTVTVEAPPPEPAPTRARRYRFSGNGTKAVGTLKLPVEYAIRWNSDGWFEASSDYSDEAERSIGVNSDARTGSSIIPPGTYGDVEFIGPSDWSVRLVPRK
jgi:hypothetical protein